MRARQRVGEECSPLVLDRRDRFAAEAVVPAGEGLFPVRPDDGVGDAADDRAAEVRFDQQSLQAQERCARSLQQSQQAVSEDVFHARAPAIGEDPP